MGSSDAQKAEAEEKEVEKEKQKLQVLLHLHDLPGQVGQEDHLENIVEPLAVPVSTTDADLQSTLARSMPSELVNR